MPPSKLKYALAREKGVDYQQIKQKKKYKAAIKKKRDRAEKHGDDSRGALALKGSKKGRKEKEAMEDEDWEDEEDSDEGGVPVDDDEEDGDSNDDDDDDEQEIANGRLDLDALDDSDSSGSEVELEEKIERKPKSILKAKNANSETKKAKKAAAATEEEDEEEEDDDEDEEDIPMSDLEDLPEEDREDLVPHTRLTINNTTALLASLNRIAIPTDSKTTAFATHQSVVGAEPTADGIEDVQDDLRRELAFYGQSLAAARRARALLRAEGLPFSRPADYFAEMVKDDGHMEKVRAKLVEEASAKKAAAEARKLRDLKKFGKQVQVAKLQERQKAKRDTLDKIKTLKRKRQESSGDVGATEADLFDVGVDRELSSHKQNQKPSSAGRQQQQREPNAKRQKKNEKYGFGGKKRHTKSGDAASSGDLSAFPGARRMKSGGFGPGKGGKTPKTARLGKSRRNAGKR